MGRFQAWRIIWSGTSAALGRGTTVLTRQGRQPLEESRHEVPGVVAMEMEKSGGPAADGWVDLMNQWGFLDFWWTLMIFYLKYHFLSFCIISYFHKTHCLKIILDTFACVCACWPALALESSCCRWGLVCCTSLSSFLDQQATEHILLMLMADTEVTKPDLS